MNKKLLNSKNICSMALMTSIYLTPSLVGAVDPASLPDAGKTAGAVNHSEMVLPKYKDTNISIEQPIRPMMQADNSLKVVVRQFRITGQALYPADELAALLKDSLNQELTFAEMEKQTDIITNYFRQKGYLVAKAYLPAQQISDGMVDIAVIVGKYDKIVIKNNTAVSDAVAYREMGAVQSGAYIEKEALERAVWLLSDLAGAEAKLTLEPGDKVGTSNLVVNLEKRTATSQSLSIDNYGNRFTGSIQETLALNLPNVAKQGDTLSVRVNLTHHNLMNSENVSYSLPAFGQGQKLNIGYSTVHYRLGDEYAAADANGTATTTSLAWDYALYRSQTRNLYGEIRYENGKLQDKVGLDTTDKSNKGVTFSLNGDNLDKNGASSYALSYKAGTLHIDSDAAKQQDDSTTHSDGSYGKFNVNFVRQQSITASSYLLCSLSGQLATKNLASAEKLSLGGALGVRAYPQGEAAGDEGYLATLEYRWLLPVKDKQHESLQLAAFIDNGSIRVNKNSWNNDANTRTLTGAGLGILWNKDDYAVKINYAWKLGSEKSTSDNDRSGRLWVQGMKRF